MFQGFVARKVWQQRGGTIHVTFRVGEPPLPPAEGNGTQTIYFPDEKPRFHRELVNMLMLPTCFLSRAKKQLI